MKQRAPRNRTLSIQDDERDSLIGEAMVVDKNLEVSDLENKILFQDIFDCADYLPDDFIDLMIVDPPYNLDKLYGKTKFSKVGSSGYEEWFESWLVKIMRCLKKDASVYVCCDWKTSRLVQPLLEKHFRIRNRITWEREKGRGAQANWKNCSEDIWFCTVSDDYFFDVDAVKLKKKVIAPYRDASGEPKDWEETAGGNFRLTHPSNLWTDISIPFWSMPENTDHPTQKPEKLVAKLILASSSEGDFIFDPFLGSGTTAVVAKKLGRRYAGVEREEEYCHYAVKRLQLAEEDKVIQGYHDGYFWERNSAASQKKIDKKDRESNDTVLFDE